MWGPPGPVTLHHCPVPTPCTLPLPFACVLTGLTRPPPSPGTRHSVTHREAESRQRRRAGSEDSTQVSRQPGGSGGPRALEHHVFGRTALGCQLPGASCGSEAGSWPGPGSLRGSQTHMARTRHPSPVSPEASPCLPAEPWAVSGYGKGHSPPDSTGPSAQSPSPGLLSKGPAVRGTGWVSFPSSSLKKRPFSCL